jgi:hypothetical protein
MERPQNHKLLKTKFKVLGEVYLDIDYTNIAYINDTGRNWTNGKSNIRDKVSSQINADFKSSDDLISYLEKKPHNKICFQIHPERWDNKYIPWFLQLGKDSAINSLKYVFNLIR